MSRFPSNARKKCEVGSHQPLCFFLFWGKYAVQWTIFFTFRINFTWISSRICQFYYFFLTKSEKGWCRGVWVQVGRVKGNMTPFFCLSNKLRNANLKSLFRLGSLYLLPFFCFGTVFLHLELQNGIHNDAIQTFRSNKITNYQHIIFVQNRTSLNWIEPP